MDSLTVQACLSNADMFAEKAHSTGNPGGNQVFAVFTNPEGSGSFCGLVTSQEISAQPGLSFGELLNGLETPKLLLSATIYEALEIMNRTGRSLLPVTTESGTYAGIVTHANVLLALSANELLNLSELQDMKIRLDELNKNAMTRMERLLDLERTSKVLLGTLAVTPVEVNTLQVCIEALATLLRVRYCAIGILDELDASGKALKHFVTTGFTPEIEKAIGDYPKGKGLLGVVIEEKSILNIENISKDPRSEGFPINHPNMKSLLAVPIYSGSRVYGRIYLSEKLNGLPFNENDEATVQKFALSIASALTRIGLTSL